MSNGSPAPGAAGPNAICLAAKRDLREWWLRKCQAMARAK